MGFSLTLHQLYHSPLFANCLPRCLFYLPLLCGIKLVLSRSVVLILQNISKLFGDKRWSSCLIFHLLWIRAAAQLYPCDITNISYPDMKIFAAFGLKRELFLISHTMRFLSEAKQEATWCGLCAHSILTNMISLEGPLCDLSAAVFIITTMKNREM